MRVVGCCINYLVCDPLEPFQGLFFRPYPFKEGFFAGCKGVLSPCLAVSTHQDIIGRVQKNNVKFVSFGPESEQDILILRKKRLLPKIHDKGDP